MENKPVASVVVPICVPFMVTLTPANASPLASCTFPDIVRFAFIAASVTNLGLIGVMFG